jgi:hypothetical protein
MAILNPLAYYRLSKEVVTSQNGCFGQHAVALPSAPTVTLKTVAQ